MDAKYVFAIAFRLRSGSVRVEPDRFETRLYRPADDPGEPGWRFFRDNLWRGEVADEEHVRDLLGDDLGVEVESVEFRAFDTDREYLDALEEAVADELEEYRAETVREVTHKYFGSKIEVRNG